MEKSSTISCRAPGGLDVFRIYVTEDSHISVGRALKFAFVRDLVAIGTGGLGSYTIVPLTMRNDEVSGTT